MNIISVPSYSCVDVFVCSLNHLLRVHRSLACLRQTTARTQNEVQHFAGETRGASGLAQELRGPFGKGPAKPVSEHHLPFGACLESEAVRTAQDSPLAVWKRHGHVIAACLSSPRAYTRERSPRCAHAHPVPFRMGPLRRGVVAVRHGDAPSVRHFNLSISGE